MTQPALAAAVSAAMASGLPAQEPQADPRARAAIAELEARLATHAFFQRVALAKVERTPFVFFLQRPPKDQALYERSVVNSYLPFLQELLDIWQRDYGKPAGLQLRPEATLIPIAVLASKGSYADYAQAVRAPAMHAFRAHYDPELRLAVSYQDAFAPAGEDVRNDQRTALLHEVVHALQHGCAPHGRMPPGLWWREGLADFRAAGTTTIASSLREPRLSDPHLLMLASVWSRADLRPLFGDLHDLLAADDYGAVVLAGRKRLPGIALDEGLLLGLFYAKACALVEFLHQGEDGRHLPGLHRYLAELYRGGTGHTELPAALGLEHAELERQFHLHLQARLRLRYGEGLKLPQVAGAPAGAPLPPATFDRASLAWRDEELAERIAAAHTHCAEGDYEGAMELLAGPAAPAAEQLVRARARIAGLPALRDELLATAQQRKRKIRIEVGETRLEGTVVRIDVQQFLLRAGKQDQELPKSVLRPDFLLREGRVQGRFAAARWLDTFLAWLDGASMSKLAPALARPEPEIQHLRDDLAAAFDAGAGGPGVALFRLQRAALPDEPAAAARDLGELRKLLSKHGSAPLITFRHYAIDEYLRALAPRAFSLADAACLGLVGSVEPLDAGRIRVRYQGREEIASDFVHEKEWWPHVQAALPELATDRTELRKVRGGYELVGSGLFRWRLPLIGAQKLELRFELTGPTLVNLWLCGSEDGSAIQCGPDGTVTIVDPAGNLVDTVGKARQLWVGRENRLRVEHDGDKLRALLGDQQTADLQRVGSRTQGMVGFFVHGSNAVRITELAIEGTIDPAVAASLRQQFVDRTLRELLR